jgi:uncharacterized protein DUF6159
VNRIRQGWELAGRSWETLRDDRSLAAFPVLGGLSVLFLAAAFGIPAALNLKDHVSALGVILAALGLYAVSFAGVFFSVALAAAASQVLDGENATVGSGLAVARARIPQIAGWAGVVASVNLVIQALEARFSGIGALLLRGVQVAWGLVTFLAIPVIALEGLGPLATLRRSAALFRQRWGEQVTGQVSIGLAVFLAAMLPAILVIVIGVAILGPVAPLGFVLIAVGVAALLVAIVLSTCLSQIFGVALYRYAARGEAGGPFTSDELAAAVGRRS